MRRGARLSIGLAVGAASCPFLPLYVARDMTRSFMTGGGGDRISYDWSLHTLGGFVEKMRYMDAEQHPRLMLAGNVGLALVYAAVIAMIIYWMLGTLAARRSG